MRGENRGVQSQNLFMRRPVAFVGNSVFFNLVVEQPAIDLQAARRFCLISTGFAKSLFDQSSLEFREGLVEGKSE